MTVDEFAKRVQEGEQASLRRVNLACEANLHNAETSVKPGRKWTKVDVGPSGKYMIDGEGNIYGIKGYGVPHLGHYYGNLSNPNPECFQGRWG